METKKQNSLCGVESPFKYLARQLDDPTEAEAVAWVNLTGVEKCVLIRGAMQSEAISGRGWFELMSSQRMAIRSTLEKMSRAARAFGGCHA
tara:strand:- start:31 stop:303 length:273 start_codon:yes stop_codon:yes gene_type:complete